jgi:hypothetical protein
VNPAGAIIDLDHSMDKNNRQRVRDGSTEHSGFAPTGAKGFHVPMKFGHFYKGSSHRFEVDPTVTDFIIESGKAKKLIRARKFQEALAIYLALANDKKATPLQESHALKQAIHSARRLKDDSLVQKLEARFEN